MLNLIVAYNQVRCVTGTDKAADRSPVEKYTMKCNAGNLGFLDILQYHIRTSLKLQELVCILLIDHLTLGVTLPNRLQVAYSSQKLGFSPCRLMKWQ